MSFSKFMTTAAALVLLLPLSSNAQTLQEYHEDVTEPYQEEVQEQYFEQARQQLEDGAAKEWLEDTSRNIYDFGNPILDLTLEIDSLWVREAMVLSCNSTEYQTIQTHFHSYDDLQTEPEFESDEGIHPAGAVCDIHIFEKYDPDGLGLPAGECLTIIPTPWFILCYWAHVVDYYWPVAHYNSGKRVFQSRYLPMDENIQALIETWLHLSIFGGLKTVQQVLEYVDILGIATINNVTGLAEALGTMAQPRQLGVQGNPDGWRQSPNAGRFLVAGYDPEDHFEYQNWHPHKLLEEPMYASELDENVRLMHYWLTESDDDEHDGRKQEYEDWKEDTLHPCVNNNIANEKTPDEPWTEGSFEAENSERGDSFVGEFGDLPCLKNVGEVRPYTNYRRIHASDGFFQTFVKGMKNYRYDYPQESYSFRMELDRLHWLPEMLHGDELQHNDEYAETLAGDSWLPQVNCPMFARDHDKNEPLNIDYLAANQYVKDSNEETSTVIFNGFSGCYSYMPEWFWMITWRYLPSMHENIIPGLRAKFRTR